MGTVALPRSALPSRAGATAALTNGPPEPLLEIRARRIWAFLRKQPISYWLICFYLFLEYVRPQQVWPVLDFLPWAQLAIWGSLAALVIEGKVPGLNAPLLKLYLLFVFVVLASSLTAVDPSASWRMLYLPLSWFLVFVLVTSIVNTERRFLVFMLSFLLYSTKMSQHGTRTWIQNGFGFSDWGATGAPGWFHNSGEFGIQMCVFLPIAVEFILALKRYWPRWKLWLFALMPVTAIASIIATSSRGAQLGGAAVILWMVLRSRHRVRALVWGAVVVAAVWTVMPEEQKNRFETAGDDKTSVQRTERWKAGIQIANDHPVLGIGYNNWLLFDESRTLGGLVHNSFIEAWAELGYLGLMAYLALILGTFWTNWGTRRRARSLGERGRFLYHMGHGLDGALVGYIVSGFFVTVLHYPYFWINLALVSSLRLATVAELRRARAVAARSAAAPQPSRWGQGEVAPGWT